MNVQVSARLRHRTPNIERRIKEEYQSTIHKTAVIDDGAVIGSGTRIWHFSHIMGGAVIGRDCVLGQNVFVGNGVVIGDRCRIQNNVSLYEGVILESDVFVGPSAVFTNIKCPRASINQKDRLEQTFIRRGATIGANATIICGVAIGKDAFVAAGAVVTRDVQPGVTVAGVPAEELYWD